MPAAWGCQACARALCPDCAELLEVPGGVEVVGCRACGGSAPPLRIPGPEESFVASLRGLLRMPVTALGFAGLWLLAATAGTVARPAGPVGAAPLERADVGGVHRAAPGHRGAGRDARGERATLGGLGAARSPRRAGCC